MTTFNGHIKLVCVCVCVQVRIKTHSSDSEELSSEDDGNSHKKKRVMVTISDGAVSDGEKPPCDGSTQLKEETTEISMY